MELTLAIHPITAIRFGHSTGLDGTLLDVDAEQLQALLLEDQTLTAVDLEIACPGESCRAGPVFDIIEPRAKAPDSSPDFPGILGPPHTAGFGTTHVLEGAAVTVLREKSPGDSRGAIGYVLEMSGEPAAGSKYSSLQHLIIMPHTAAGSARSCPAKSLSAGRTQGRCVSRARWHSIMCLGHARRLGVSIHPLEHATECRASPMSDRYFRVRESRCWTSRFFTVSVPMACCRSHFTPTNGSTAQ